MRRGQLIDIYSKENADGELVAQIISLPIDSWVTKSEREGLLRHRGKIRAIGQTAPDVDYDFLVVADMLYSFGLFPLGGFVRLVGEETTECPQGMRKQPAGVRSRILVAGSVANVLFAIALATAIFSVFGDNRPYKQGVVVTDVRRLSSDRGFGGWLSGINEGDIISFAGGRRIRSEADWDLAIREGRLYDFPWVVYDGEYAYPIHAGPPRFGGGTGIKVEGTTGVNWLVPRGNPFRRPWNTTGT